MNQTHVISLLNGTIWRVISNTVLNSKPKIISVLSSIIYIIIDTMKTYLLKWRSHEITINNSQLITLHACFKWWLMLLALVHAHQQNIDWSWSIKTCLSILSHLLFTPKVVRIIWIWIGWHMMVFISKSRLNIQTFINLIKKDWDHLQRICTT